LRTKLHRPLHPLQIAHQNIAEYVFPIQKNEDYCPGIPGGQVMPALYP
jgi:hypothetical protein